MVRKNKIDKLTKNCFIKIGLAKGSASLPSFKRSKIRRKIINIKNFNCFIDNHGDLNSLPDFLLIQLFVSDLISIL